MEVVETNAEGLLRDFRVTVAADDIRARVEARLAELGRGLKLPGFRPGKVPPKVLKQRFGNEIRGEVLESAVDDTYRKLLSDRGLRPAGPPEIEVVSFDEGEGLEYDVSIEILPEIELPDLSSIELDRVRITPTDADIDASIERLVQENRETREIGEARPTRRGDVVVIDFEGRLDGEAFDGGSGKGVRFELGAGRFMPEFEERLTGAEAGAPLAFEVAFPDDYDGPNGDLAGRTAAFECTVQEIREFVEPSVDDAFAQSLGVENVAALREAVSGQLRQEYARLSRGRTKRELLDKLSGAYDFEVPPRMADAEFEIIWSQIEDAREREGPDGLDEDDRGKSDEELRAEYRRIAERRVRLALLLSMIGEANGISVDNADINLKLMQQARMLTGRSEDAAEIERRLPELREAAQAVAFEDKVVDFIIEMAQANERELTFAELNAETRAQESAEAAP